MDNQIRTQAKSLQSSSSFTSGHDLRLGDWGPYTKAYIGTSHIADRARGLRFDLSIFPGMYRRRLDVPNVNWESGFHPWEATDDSSFYTYRHQVEWQDRVYLDMSYITHSCQGQLFCGDYVNDTDEPQQLVLHLAASLQFPQVSARGALLRTVEPVLPPGAYWLDALSGQVEYALSRPSDHLVYDGWRRGEVRMQDTVGGSALGRGFGETAGDQVSYCVTAPSTDAPIDIYIRYCLDAGEISRFLVVLNEWSTEVDLHGTGQFRVERIVTGKEISEAVLKLKALGGHAVLLDGIVLQPAASGDNRRDAGTDTAPAFAPVPNLPVPKLLPGPVANSLLIKYESIDHYYGLCWDYDSFEIREFHSDQLDIIMRQYIHNHVRSVFHGQGEGHYTNIYLRPIVLQAHERMTVTGLVCHGSLEEVRRELSQYNPDCAYQLRSERRATLELQYQPIHPEGDRYRLSQRLFAATLATNLVFPVYTKGAYIRHYTPGRWWDSLYTWDSGFVGLGLLELDAQRAIDCLNAYVTEPDDEQTAFIHHGTMLPVQHYLLLELFNRTLSQEMLAYFYPRLRHYYQFVAGHAAGSTTRTLSSQLLKTWDYFYNSGGWDDYPAQVMVHQRKLTRNVAPVVTTAHVIRIAKILSMAALQLGGLDHDYALYCQDIREFGEALDSAWDADSGYYAYTVHNDEGRVIDLLRDENGISMNMGMDGLTPLVAGERHRDRLVSMLERLASQDHLWTSIGLTTVSQSAPYYSGMGYWNGAVWMPHQWFFWKSLLDVGERELAWRIASTALELWKVETERSYNSYEHFIVETGRGAGWHQFTGLSSPVLIWFHAYYRRGTISLGHDVWLLRREFNTDYTALDLEWTIPYWPHATAADMMTIIVCMTPDIVYQVDGSTAIQMHERVSGTLELTVPRVISQLGESIVCWLRIRARCA